VARLITVTGTRTSSAATGITAAVAAKTPRVSCGTHVSAVALLRNPKQPFDRLVCSITRRYANPVSAALLTRADEVIE